MGVRRLLSGAGGPLVPELEMRGLCQEPQVWEVVGF